MPDRCGSTGWRNLLPDTTCACRHSAASHGDQGCIKCPCQYYRRHDPNYNYSLKAFWKGQGKAPRGKLTCSCSHPRQVHAEDMPKMLGQCSECTCMRYTQSAQVIAKDIRLEEAS